MKTEKDINQKLRQEIREFIIENFLFGERDSGLKDTDSFIEAGIIDSTGVLELVAFIEETYVFKLDDEELIPEYLDSIAKVSACVMRKQEESGLQLQEEIGP